MAIASSVVAKEQTERIPTYLTPYDENGDFMTSPDQCYDLYCYAAQENSEFLFTTTCKDDIEWVDENGWCQEADELEFGATDMFVTQDDDEWI